MPSAPSGTSPVPPRFLFLAQPGPAKMSAIWSLPDRKVGRQETRWAPAARLQLLAKLRCDTTTAARSGCRQPLSRWLKIDRDQKMGDVRQIARNFRCARTVAWIYAATWVNLTLYSESTNERSIVSLRGHLREGCDD
jgi:hypothetical protein